MPFNAMCPAATSQLTDALRHTFGVNSSAIPTFPSQQADSGGRGGRVVSIRSPAAALAPAVSTRSPELSTTPQSLDHASPTLHSIPEADEEPAYRSRRVSHAGGVKGSTRGVVPKVEASPHSGSTHTGTPEVIDTDHFVEFDSLDFLSDNTPSGSTADPGVHPSSRRAKPMTNGVIASTHELSFASTCTPRTEDGDNVSLKSGEIEELLQFDGDFNP